MSHFYTMEVHFVDYDTIGVTADSEEEAHEKAKVIFETVLDHIIGVKAVGTVAVDGEEVDNDNGERTTEWEV